MAAPHGHGDADADELLVLALELAFDVGRVVHVHERGRQLRRLVRELLHPRREVGQQLACVHRHFTLLHVRLTGFGRPVSRDQTHGIVDQVQERAEELGGRSSVDHPVVEGQREAHGRPHARRAVDGQDFVDDAADPEDAPIRAG